MSSVSNEYGHCNYCICNDCSMLYNLYVKKENRRKGHARNLVKKAIDEIRAEGYEYDIKIVANPQEDINREALVKFYEKMNLRVVNEQFYNLTRKG